MALPALGPHGAVTATGEDVQEGTLRQRNSDENRWTWDRQTDIWKPAVKWGEFFRRWRNPDLDIAQKLITAGATITLHAAGSHLELSWTQQQVYVREAYVRTYEQVWLSAERSRDAGVILAGQPKIGKTMFIWYLLVRLLQEGQVVLFYPGSYEILLFYHDTVYAAAAALHNAADLSLPCSPRGAQDVCVWSLFDVPEYFDPPEILWAPVCYPVTALSSRFEWTRPFLSSRDVEVKALPLWSRQELSDGFLLFAEADEFMASLELEVLQSWPDPPVLPGYPGVVQLLKEEYAEERPASAEDMRQTLLDIAIDYFGNAPGDVWQGLIRPQEILTDHRYIIALLDSYKNIRQVVTAFPQDMPLPPPSAATLYRALCVYPRHKNYYEAPLLWCVDFKSTWIARTASAEYVGDAQVADVCKLIESLERIPWAQSMVRHMFEPLVLRMFASLLASDTPRQWPLLQMHRVEGSDAMTFAVDPSCAAPASRGLPVVLRATEEFETTLPISLASNTYYVPAGTSLPPVDAFAVEFDERGRSAIATLWLMLTTTSDSEKHDESGRGRRWIRRLVRALRDRLCGLPEAAPTQRTHGTQRPRKKAKLAGPPTVVIHFVLISLTDEGGRVAMEMPEWWDDDIRGVGRRGDVYLLQVPIMAFVKELETRMQVKGRH
ncbi:hypothetical protein OH76DRAFT_85824 [Lentinus brumalis]|uniref:Uncharacterized protein n=1 Tax=Lentinus brumalis TaxID=2498619 RepID=A0A371CR47_9APHY|nr:hypothetical protein OH76DRAFT_85824 [Polyporus brumalis]